jgi:hypothetical protein
LQVQPWCGGRILVQFELQPEPKMWDWSSGNVGKCSRINTALHVGA